MHYCLCCEGTPEEKVIELTMILFSYRTDTSMRSTHMLEVHFERAIKTQSHLNRNETQA